MWNGTDHNSLTNWVNSWAIHSHKPVCSEYPSSTGCVVWDENLVCSGYQSSTGCVVWNEILVCGGYQSSTGCVVWDESLVCSEYPSSTGYVVWNEWLWWTSCMVTAAYLVTKYLWWETTVMRDWASTRDHHCSNMALHFYTFVLVMKDHLSHKSIFCGPVGWSLITGFTVPFWPALL